MTPLDQMGDAGPKSLLERNTAELASLPVFYLHSDPVFATLFGLLGLWWRSDQRDCRKVACKVSGIRGEKRDTFELGDGTDDHVW